MFFKKKVEICEMKNVLISESSLITFMYVICVFVTVYDQLTFLTFYNYKELC